MLKGQICERSTYPAATLEMDHRKYKEKQMHLRSGSSVVKAQQCQVARDLGNKEKMSA
jgi:hypothetical protein